MGEMSGIQTFPVLAGSSGGEFFPPQQQQQAMVQQPLKIEVVAPPQDNTLLIVSGILVPLIIAMVGWWLTHRKREALPAHMKDATTSESKRNNR